MLSVFLLTADSLVNVLEKSTLKLFNIVKNILFTTLTKLKFCLDDQRISMEYVDGGYQFYRPKKYDLPISVRNLHQLSTN